MTPLQAACLQAIKDMTRGDVPPSYEELKVRLNLSSKSHIARLVNALKVQGYVEVIPGMKRSLRVIETPPTLSKMSLAGLRELIAHAQAELDSRVNGRHR